MNLEERMAKIEGALEQINHRFSDLREDMNRRFGMLQWEVRIWFLIILGLLGVVLQKLW